MHTHEIPEKKKEKEKEKRWDMIYILVSQSEISAVGTVKDSNLLIMILQNHKRLAFSVHISDETKIAKSL